MLFAYYSLRYFPPRNTWWKRLIQYRYIALILLLILVSSGIYLIVRQNTEQSLTLSQKCSRDGQAWFQNWQQKKDPDRIFTSWTSEYHYDTKLNTCLVYVRDIQNVNQNFTGSITSPGYPITINSLVYNFVFDIYSNQAVLQSVNNRTTAWNGQDIDTLGEYPSYPNISNLDETTFNKQLQVLMNEWPLVSQWFNPRAPPRGRSRAKREPASRNSSATRRWTSTETGRMARHRRNGRLCPRRWCSGFFRAHFSSNPREWGRDGPVGSQERWRWVRTPISAPVGAHCL